MPSIRTAGVTGTLILSVAALVAACGGSTRPRAVRTGGHRELGHRDAGRLRPGCLVGRERPGDRAPVVRHRLVDAGPRERRFVQGRDHAQGRRRHVGHGRHEARPGARPDDQGRDADRRHRRRSVGGQGTAAHIDAGAAGAECSRRSTLRSSSGRSPARSGRELAGAGHRGKERRVGQEVPPRLGHGRRGLHRRSAGASMDLWIADEGYLVAMGATASRRATSRSR